MTGGGAELFLYQSGYLTIKDYKMGVYILGFPNHEVKQALYDMVLPEENQYMSNILSAKQLRRLKG